MNTSIELKVPDIGDFKDVEIIEILIKEGDTISLDQSLVTVESDKASMEIPASQAGKVEKILVKLGDKISQGSALLMLQTSAEAVPAENNSTPEIKTSVEPLVASTAVANKIEAPQTSSAAPQTIATEPATKTQTTGVKSHASPSVRKFARELGVDLTQVQGSEKHGRITHLDVQQFVKNQLQQIQKAPSATMNGAAPNTSGFNVLAWPSLDFSSYGTTETLALSRIKKISGPNLHRNWVMIPHVTQHDEADITELEAFRKAINEESKKDGIKLTLLAFVIKACVSVLQKNPEFNSSLDESGQNIILKHYYHIGFAADTPNGLTVPVIKNADQKGVLQIAQELTELSAQARAGKLKPSDMQGASFTISSLGGVGGTYFTPIINAPEVAILGLSKSSIKPVWNGKEFVPRLMLPLSLSYDHRVIDGAMAARFTTQLGQVLCDMRRSLL